METILKLLLLVQRQWGSLESIFLASADIRAQLPEDTKRFETVDNEFKEQMRDIQVSSMTQFIIILIYMLTFIILPRKSLDQARRTCLLPSGWP